ncbi:MAG: helical backbone metal receptor, partial [Myxococcota bacterium]|nr:helical backbone metal receptor [Myxococcota bacterium]
MPEASASGTLWGPATLRRMLRADVHDDRSAVRRFGFRAGVVVAVLFLLESLASAAGAPARRVVSLNPSLSAIALALGAEEALVGVDDFSARQQPALSDRPRVGGLFNPSLEAVVALDPDLVVLVPSAEQRDLRRRLESLGIRVETFENVRFDQVLENIERMGRLLGRRDEASRRVAEIRRAHGELEAAIVDADRPKVVVVLQRDPLFVVGRGSFVEEMLRVAGGANVAARFEDPYPRVDVEWLVAAAPEVVIDMAPGPSEAMDYWSRWPTLPAVSQGRVLTLDPRLVTLPGPEL